MNKAIEGNITENRILTKEDWNEKLNKINGKIERVNFLIKDDVDFIEHWTQRLNELETEKENILKEIDNLKK